MYGDDNDVVTIYFHNGALNTVKVKTIAEDSDKRQNPERTTAYQTFTTATAVEAHQNDLNMKMHQDLVNGKIAKNSESSTPLQQSFMINGTAALSQGQGGQRKFSTSSAYSTPPVLPSPLSQSGYLESSSPPANGRPTLSTNGAVGTEGVETETKSNKNVVESSLMEPATLGYAATAAAWPVALPNTVSKDQVQNMDPVPNLADRKVVSFEVDVHSTGDSYRPNEDNSELLDVKVFYSSASEDPANSVDTAVRHAHSDSSDDSLEVVETGKDITATVTENTLTPTNTNIPTPNMFAFQPIDSGTVNGSGSGELVHQSLNDDSRQFASSPDSIEREYLQKAGNEINSDGRQLLKDSQKRAGNGSVKHLTNTNPEPDYGVITTSSPANASKKNHVKCDLLHRLCILLHCW